MTCGKSAAGLVKRRTSSLSTRRPARWPIWTRCKRCRMRADCHAMGRKTKKKETARRNNVLNREVLSSTGGHIPKYIAFNMQLFLHPPPLISPPSSAPRSLLLQATDTSFAVLYTLFIAGCLRAAHESEALRRYMQLANALSFPT